MMFIVWMNISKMVSLLKRFSVGTQHYITGIGSPKGGGLHLADMSRQKVMSNV